ncbi:MAG: M48 family metalloprotease, partial [Nitrospinaceae bacterium]
MRPFKHRVRTTSLILLLAGLIFLLSSAPSLAVPFISKDTELAMGQEADKQVIGQFGLYDDKSLQLYVNDIGQKLVSTLSDKEFNKYFFKVVDSSDINAFALPGGYIYVTRGILATINSEAELAGILGHEIGHVTQHHGAKQIVRTIGAQILAIGAAVANPKNAGEWLILSSQMFNQIN